MHKFNAFRPLIAFLLLVGLFPLAAFAQERVSVTENADTITIETNALSAVIAKTGYVSGIKAGTLIDKKTGAHDLGYGLHIQDWLMAPGWRDDGYPRDTKLHGNLPKHIVEGPQLCTQAKVVAAEMATAAGIPTIIASGLVPGTLAAAATGSAVGTAFPAREGRYSSFKLWLKYAKPTRGRVLVDAGAARALREDGTSLLPVGVVDVTGSFDAGDAVEIAHEQVAVGKGISNYSAAELRQVRGLQSRAVHELLPLASDEAIHRDYFVLS